MSQSSTASNSGVDGLGNPLAAVVNGQTYRNLLYLLLSFPLGLCYFTLIVVGFSLGLGLSVLLVGIGIFFATILAVRAIASVERELANALLGTDIDDPNDLHRKGPGVIEIAKAYTSATSTWRSLGFVLLKFWLGVASFVLLVVSLGTAAELVLLPVSPEGTLNVQVFGWEAADTFQTQTQQLLAVPLGLALALVALPVLNAFARVNASVAEALLGSGKEQALDAQRE